MKEGDDALVHLYRTRAALGIANRRMVSGRDCMANVRKQFAEGKN